MNTKFVLAFATLIFLISCKNSSTDTKVETPLEPLTLTKIWESDSVFTTVESVIYDPVTDVIYTSNIEGEPWTEDGHGSIGRLKMDGSVIDAKWITGLNAPKGLAIANGKLYVADIMKLVEIDIASGKIENTYVVDGSIGLNDVTSAPDGTVYFTDSKKGVAHMFKNGVVSTIIDSLKSSNGIFYEKDRLLLGTWGDESLCEYKFNDGTLNIVADSLFQPDGIEAVGDGSYLVSAWSGLINYVHPDGTTELLLDTAKDTISSADIDFVQEKKILLVPTFFRNTVVAYQLNR